MRSIAWLDCLNPEGELSSAPHPLNAQAENIRLMQTFEELKKQHPILKHWKSFNDCPVDYNLEEAVRDAKGKGKKWLKLSIEWKLAKIAFDDVHKRYWDYVRYRDAHRPKCYGHSEGCKKCSPEKCWHWWSCWTLDHRPMYQPPHRHVRGKPHPRI